MAVKFFNNSSKIALVVEYDGRRYYGFQWQPGLPTIQSELEQAVRKLTRERKRVMSASRTDTGVHAKGQVVSFRTGTDYPPETFIRALNYYLPEDIAVLAAERVDDDFNVRRDALSREYEYRILNRAIRSPLITGFTYLVHGELDIDRMNEACELLKGTHDFSSFAASLGQKGSMVRNVHKAVMRREGDMVLFHITANAFLPHQVRNTVGLMIRLGQGKVTLEEFHEIMEQKTLGMAGPAAPAHGLCLMKVNYPEKVELQYENLFN
ncbi:MAG: tRNA pseudouridine(38-40) synthase TruA [Dehalococcoidia bacterium]